MNMEQVQVGFLGTGVMGAPMAACLLRSGFSVSVWNRTADKCQPLQAQGAKVMSSPVAVAAAAEILILCLSDTAAIDEVLFGAEGVVTAPADQLRDLLIIDMSTVSPAASRECSDKLAGHGIAMLDAPVSGSREGACQGTLSIMVGGSGEKFDQVRPLLAAMGTTLVHVGERCGDGQTVKLVNQLLASGHTLIMSEALLFAQAGGVDLEKTLEAVSAGAAGSWMLSNRGPQVIRRDFSPAFSIDLQIKSLEAVLAVGSENGAPLPTTAQLYQYYRSLQAQGLGGEGHHAVIKALEGLAGFQVGPISSPEPDSNKESQ